MTFTIPASPAMEQYFQTIQAEIKCCYTKAAEARALNLDPEPTVPIPLAENMAERVVGLISVLAPQVATSGITVRIMELEKEFGRLDWRVGFVIAEEVAQQKWCSFRNSLEALEMGIRVGFAYLTLGIVSAPLEGFIGLKLKKRKDGKEYFAVRYAGPIRGAGGTAASISVILADYVRIKFGYAPYDPEEAEINRSVAEVADYHERVTNLQYFPSEEELRFLLSHLPVEVDGDPTEKIEVSNYKDLPRIETNFIRGGVPLVLAEGLCQKAAKIWKRLGKWGQQFSLEWGWLAEFLKVKEQVHASQAQAKGNESMTRSVQPNNTFLMDLVAGRPILTYPLRPGGFRLRYGRTRTSGFSATALHPATLLVLDKYIAIGTQLKVERPGKAAAVTVCETIDGPIVKLQDGSVVALKTESSARQYLPQIEEIIYLGDILFNYGDFSENGQRLVPAGYCPEWWAAELQQALEKKEERDVEEKLALERLQELSTNYFTGYPTFEEAVALSQTLNLPLHPEYTLFWKLVTAPDLVLLLSWLQQGEVKSDEEGLQKIIIPYYSSVEHYVKSKSVLESLGVEHHLVNKELVVLEQREAKILGFCFGFTDQDSLKALAVSDGQGVDGLQLIQQHCPVPLRDKAGTFIGARMGRPEKAKMRHLTGSPQMMFPVGGEGDRLRSVQAAVEAGKVNSTFPLFYCSACQRSMIYPSCEECHARCEKRYYCRICGDILQEQCRHGPGQSYKTFDLDIGYYFKKAKDRLGDKVHPELVKGVRGTSNKNHVVEHLAKGLLRAKHAIYVNKDGTTRYDCTELPITHFKPKEIKTSLEKLKQLGYGYDIHKQELVDDDQVLELKPQDLILPSFDSIDESAPQVLKRVAGFVDDLLVRFYRQEPFYQIKNEEGLVGQLVIGLAPHISAGLIGRIIGFSDTQGLLAHPLYHAGMRRDADGDEAAIMLLMDALLNFSRQFLPNTRGSTMDSPLVLTSILNPSEVDDQVHGLDVAWRYPVELYEAALEMKFPWEVRYQQKKVEQLGDRLGTPQQYEGLGYTHPVDNFNKAVTCSAYKTKPSMEEKLLGQMEIARKIRAVDLDDVAKLVIQKHFLKDIKGNLKKFSMQQFRCVKCNEKYRRPPLVGKCLACGNKLLFTITEGSVVKYLGPSLLLAQKYEFSPYLKQVLQVLKVNVDSVFGKEKEKQVGLSGFIGPR
ncbi:MAG: DNA polymerase II large subunit [Nanoarchaeota archaeon]